MGRTPAEELKVTLEDDFHGLIRNLAHEQNIGRHVVINQVAYESLGIRSTDTLPPDAKGQIKVGFLDNQAELNPRVWGIVNLYGRVETILRWAHAQRVAIQLDVTQPVPEYTTVLPYQDKESVRFLQTCLPFAGSLPLQLFLPERPSVEEEAAAVETFLNSLNASIQHAYGEKRWPIINPQECTRLHQSLSFHDVLSDFRRSRERYELFGSKGTHSPSTR